MNISTTEVSEARAVHVRVTKDALVVDLDDGRTVFAPIAWYPRLHHATAKERNNCRLIGNGEGIHWPDLDEDISVDGLLRGKASGESQRSFKAWLEARGGARSNTYKASGCQEDAAVPSRGRGGSRGKRPRRPS